MNDEWSAAWQAAANRSEFKLVVLTPARAKLDGVVLHKDAVLVAQLVPDDRPSYFLGFTSAESLGEFIREMQPHSTEVRAAPGDSAGDLMSAIGLSPGSALH